MLLRWPRNLSENFFDRRLLNLRVLQASDAGLPLSHNPRDPRWPARREPGPGRRQGPWIETLKVPQVRRSQSKKQNRTLSAVSCQFDALYVEHYDKNTTTRILLQLTRVKWLAQIVKCDSVLASSQTWLSTVTAMTPHRSLTEADSPVTRNHTVANTPKTLPQTLKLFSDPSHRN